MKTYDMRKKEILDTAQQMFFTQGYDKTSIQAIIDALGIAKGTFYHYFKSKADLLDQLAKRMAEQLLEQVAKEVEQSSGNGLEKLNLVIKKSNELKSGQSDFILMLLEVMNKEENWIMRDKIKEHSIQITLPLLTEIILQGVREGIFHTPYPESVGEVILRLGAALSEQFGDLVLSLPENRENFDILLQKIELYQHSMEAILGVPGGSIKVFDRSGLERFCKALMKEGQ